MSKYPIKNIPTKKNPKTKLSQELIILKFYKKKYMYIFIIQKFKL